MPKYIRPTASTAISDDFDAHVARGSANPGTDYITARGLPVLAPAAGKIVDVDPFLAGSGGRMIALDTTDGDGFDFLHLSRIDVNVGEYVQQGQQIALTGASAWDSETGVGAHLHLSFRQHHGSHYTDAGNVDFEKYLTSPAGGSSGIPTSIESDMEMALFLGNNTIAWPNGFCNSYTPNEYEAMRLVVEDGDRESSRVATYVRESWEAANFIKEATATATVELLKQRGLVAAKP